VFSLFRRKPTSTQAFSNFYLPFPKKLGQTMQFCISTCVNFIEIYLKLLHIFSYVVPYWHALEKNVTKMTSLKIFLQTNRFTINIWFQCIGHCVEVRALIFDISNFFFLKSYLSKKIVKLQTKACPIVVVTSNNPILTCLGYQSFPKKLMTKDTSYGPLDIQRSKQVVAKWHFASARKT
jgi:hypothetical protein